MLNLCQPEIVEGRHKSNQWSTQPAMPKSCHGLGSAVVDGYIHLLNGGPQPGGGGSTYHQVFRPE